MIDDDIIKLAQQFNVRKTLAEVASETVSYSFDAVGFAHALLAAAKEQEEIRLAAVTSACLGYWKEGDTISPQYDHPALRDAAQLYAKYRAALAAAAPVASPAGFKLVPIAPTQAMMDAAEKTVPQVFSMGDEYRAMVAAAPAPVAAPDVGLIKRQTGPKSRTCVWCGQLPENAGDLCSAPDGDGHLFDV